MRKKKSKLLPKVALKKKSRLWAAFLIGIDRKMKQMKPMKAL